VAKQ